MSGDEIERRLRGVEAAAVRIETMLSATLTTMSRSLESLDRQVFGTHSDNPGLVLRVDRIEGHERIRRWFTRTALGAALTALVGMLWRQFFND